MRVSVIGSSAATGAELERAEAVGRAVADRGHELICGGLGGVMRAAAMGAAAEGGRTIGILPGTDPADANDHVEVAVATGLGHMRNALVVRNGDGVVAVGGRYGTLSEIAFALDMGRPVVGLGTHDVEGVVHVASASEALDRLERHPEGS